MMNKDHEKYLKGIKLCIFSFVFQSVLYELFLSAVLLYFHEVSLGPP